MDSLLSLGAILLIVGAVQGFILSIFLLAKKSNRYANVPLGIIVLLLSSELLYSLMYLTGYISKVPFLMNTFDPFTLLYGPLFLFYARNQVVSKFVFRKIDLVFFIPFLFLLVYNLKFYFQPSFLKINQYEKETVSWSTMGNYQLKWLAEVCYNLIFIVLAIGLLNRYHKKIKNRSSDIAKINLYINKRLITICFVLYVSQIILVIYSFFGTYFLELFIYLLYILIAISIYLIGYTDLLRQGTLSAKSMDELEDEEWCKNTQIKQKYEKSSLDKITSEIYVRTLLDYMESRKPHMQEGLKVKDLAEMLSIPTHHLSQIINENLNKNFYDFINQYRIEEAKQLLFLPEYNNYTYSAIGFEVGFSSKSAFYTAFKKHTGTTPLKFKNSSN